MSRAAGRTNGLAAEPKAGACRPPSTRVSHRHNAWWIALCRPDRLGIGETTGARLAFARQLSAIIESLANFREDDLPRVTAAELTDGVGFMRIQDEYQQHPHHRQVFDHHIALRTVSGGIDDLLRNELRNTSMA